MSKSLYLLQNNTATQTMSMDAPQSPDSSQSSEEKREMKKPCKTTRKQRVNQFIRKINDDTIEQVVKDILEENVRLRKEIEALRVQNVSLKREHEELIHAILQDRLKNQNSDLEF